MNVLYYIACPKPSSHDYRNYRNAAARIVTATRKYMYTLYTCNTCIEVTSLVTVNIVLFKLLLHTFHYIEQPLIVTFVWYSILLQDTSALLVPYYFLSKLSKLWSWVLRKAISHYETPFKCSILIPMYASEVFNVLFEGQGVFQDSQISHLHVTFRFVTLLPVKHMYYLILLKVVRYCM